MAKIRFPQYDLEVDAPSGTEFLELYTKNPKLPLKFGCRRGDCGVCAIRVLGEQKHLTKQSPQEAITLHNKGLDVEHHRLACQCAFNGDVAIDPASGRN